MRNFLLGVVAVIVMLGIIGGAYYYGTQSKSTEKEQRTVAVSTKEPEVGVPLPTKTPSPTPKENMASEVNEQIIAAIKSKNTQALSGYMADMVSVRLEATECCGSIAKSEAISQLSYLDPATGWDFNPTNPILVNLAAAVPNYYGSGWTVGVASNEYVFAFKLNNANKLDAYNISGSYKLLIP
ncbi:hypothetical protein ACFL0F_01415 [Patescibacteria group bacterium]